MSNHGITEVLMGFFRWLASTLIVAVILPGPQAAAAPGDGGLKSPRTLVVDGAGNLFITDTENHRIVRIEPSGAMTVVAGTGKPGDGGDGGPATAAQLKDPHGIAVDAAGNVYVADSPNHRIRRIDPAGVIITVAGTGTAGFSGDGGPATAAQLNRPRNLIVAPDGALIIADTDNHRIRRVDRAGTITTIAGSGASEASGDGGPATAAGFADPRDVALDAAGNLYVADTMAHRIRRIDASGTMTTVAGTGAPGFSGDNGPGTAALLNEPRGVAVDPAGDLFIADSSNNRVRWMDRAGTIRTLFGTGRRTDTPDGMGLADPRGVNTDHHGRVYVADTGNNRVVQVR
ncbi:MAG: NHL repeat-containing protein [Actinomycetota bacterium]|nr:NHL repeat-containing protein [Actinomycetota bacterium]